MAAGYQQIDAKIDLLYAAPSNGPIQCYVATNQIVRSTIGLSWRRLKLSRQPVSIRLTDSKMPWMFLSSWDIPLMIDSYVWENN